MTYEWIAPLFIISVAGLIYYYRQKTKRNIDPALFRLTTDQLKDKLIANLVRKNLEEDKCMNLLSILLDKKLHKNFDINFTSAERGSTCLSICSRVGSVELLTRLINNGADVNKAEKNGNTPLHLAVRMGKKKNMMKLLESGAKQDVRNAEGHLPLHLAAHNGRIECIQESFVVSNFQRFQALFDYGGKSFLNATDNNGDTPLHLAAENGHEESLKFLIDSGGQTNFTDNYGETPLHKAAANGIVQCMSLLLDNGAKVVSNRSGETPMHRAIIQGHRNAVTMLLARDSSLMSTFVDLLFREENQKILGVLEHVSATSPSYQLEILQRISERASLLGEVVLAKEDSISASKFRALMKAFHLIGNQNTQVFRQIDLNKPLRPLWTRLDDKLVAWKEDQQVHFLTIIIEAFVQFHLDAKDEESLRSFLNKHSHLISKQIEKNPDLIFGPLDFIITNKEISAKFQEHVKSLGFEKKESWLREKIHQEKARGIFVGISLEFQRSEILPASCSGILNQTPSSLKGEINIRFKGENGVGSGIRREWFRVLISDLFNADNALFTFSSNNTYQPNPRSYVNADHLSYFHLVGRVIGMSVYHNELVDVHFTRSFYKHILGVKVTYEDMESLDSGFYKILLKILDSSVEDLDLTFSSNVDMFGRVDIVDLIPNGRDVEVNDVNKEEYVKSLAEFKLTKEIQQQIDSFLQGFYELVPRNFIGIFNEYELELLISGLPEIDVVDWQNNSEYTNGYTCESPQIKWFWALVSHLSQAERALLLQFATGSSKVPVGGFKNLRGLHGAQKFSVSRLVETKQLPSASTCFNILKIPEYESEQELRRLVMVAIKHGSTGFAFN